MYWKPGIDVEEYLDWCKENSCFPRYRGSKPFQELLKRGRIMPFVTTIRIMYTGTIDQCYCLDEDGMFLLINDPDNPPQNPEEILREDKHPEGWEVEMAKPKHFLD